MKSVVVAALILCVISRILSRNVLTDSLDIDLTLHLWENPTSGIMSLLEVVMKKQQHTVHMDDKQRVSLTRMLTKKEREELGSFRMYREGAKIILEPVVEVPQKDHWIYKNPKAFASLMKGIKDAEEGRLHDLGSFAQYADEDADKDE
jgi:hypothetical protein